MYKIKIFATIEISITDFFDAFSKLGFTKTSIEIMSGYSKINNLNPYLLTSDDLTEIMEFGSSELFQNGILSTEEL